MAVLDLGVLAEVRKENDDLKQENEELRQQLFSIQVQMGAIIYAAKDHKITLNKEAYTGLPSAYRFTQEDNEDGSFTVGVEPAVLHG